MLVSAVYQRGHAGLVITPHDRAHPRRAVARDPRHFGGGLTAGEQPQDVIVAAFHRIARPAIPPTEFVNTEMWGNLNSFWHMIIMPQDLVSLETKVEGITALALRKG
jgi:hypothetical protein